jgi:hypothetical protein
MKKMGVVGAVLVLALGAIWALPARAQEGAGFKNLQVLPKDISRTELKATMEGFTEELQVKCTFCHVPDQYDKDDVARKQDARRMIRLVSHMKANSGQYFKDGFDARRISCFVCHRGKSEPDTPGGE